MPISSAAARMIPKVGAAASSSRPTSVNAMPIDERVRHRTTIGVQPDERLQHRSGQLLRQRHHPDLREAQRKRRLQHRIDRWEQRLDRVVEQMGQADTGEHRDGGSRGLRAFVADHDQNG